MRRSELLALTGLTAARFGNLFHREQLPFRSPGEERKGWADYTVDEAVQLALMLALMELHWPIEQALAATRDHFDVLIRERDRHERSNQDLQFGVAVEVVYLPTDWAEPDDWVVHGFAGTVDELSNAMGEPAVTEVLGTVLVNASATVRRMIHRGRARGAKTETLDALKTIWRIEEDV